MSQVAGRTQVLRVLGGLLLGVTAARAAATATGAWTRFGTIDVLVACTGAAALAAAPDRGPRDARAPWSVDRHLVQLLALVALGLTVARALLSELGVGVPVGASSGSGGWTVLVAGCLLAVVSAVSRSALASRSSAATALTRALRRAGELRHAHGTATLAALGAVLLAGLFVSFYKLGRPSWTLDELVYRAAGLAYIAHGDFSLNHEHVFLAKDLIGAAQLLFGSGPTVVRLPAALAGVLTGGALFLFARAVGGLLAAASVFALWLLLPHPIHVDSGNLAVISLERYALLDPLMILFVVAALGFGWRWIETGSWRWASWVGVGGGLAVASKVTAACVLPGLVVCGVAMARDRRRSLWQSGAIAALTLIVLLVSYLPPLGDSPSSFGDLLHLQRVHAELGHPVVIDGHVYARAPWWAHMWWVWHSLGPLPTVALLVCAVVAPLAIGWRLGTYLWVAAAVPFLYLSLFVGFGLPHYYMIWTAPLTLLGALGFAGLWRLGSPARVAALAVGAGLAVSMLGTIVDVARLGRNDYSAAAAMLRRDGLGQAHVAVWYGPQLLGPYLSDARISSAPVPGERLDAVVVDPEYAETVVNRSLQGYVFLARSNFAACHVSRLTVYVRVRPTVTGRVC